MCVFVHPLVLESFQVFCLFRWTPSWFFFFFFHCFPVWSKFWESWLKASPNSPTNELCDLELITPSLSLIFPPEVFVKTVNIVTQYIDVRRNILTSWTEQNPETVQRTLATQ